MQKDWGGTNDVQKDWGGTNDVQKDWGGTSDVQKGWGGASDVLQKKRAQKIGYTSRFVRVILAQGPC